ncbi:MAG: glycosyltransferase family 39 protein [Chloroflexota bacterium]
MSGNTQPYFRSRAAVSLRIVACLLVGVALLVFIGYFVVYTNYAAALFRFPFDYDQGEGFELMDTVLFSRGRWPYQDINRYPFYSSNYPPLFHLLTVPLVWLFGPQYWTGRLVSYLATLVTAGAIGYAVQREGKRWWLSLIAGLSFLASNYVYHVGSLFRQHLTMVTFETLAVVAAAVVIQKEERRGSQSWRGWLVVMLLLLAAGYTKQLAYATVAAVFVFLFLRQPKRAIRWAIPFGLVTGLIFLGINVATNGQWLTNTITANLNPFVPGQAIGLYQQWFKLHTLLIVVAAVFSVYQLYFERLSAYTIWFVLATVNSVTAGKWGAGESYFTTAIAASCVLTGIGLARLLNRFEQESSSQDRHGWAGLTDWCKRISAWRAAAYVNSSHPRPSAQSAPSAFYLAQAIVALLFLWQASLVFHLPTHTPLLRSVASLLGQPAEVMVAPQTSCSAPRPPQPVPYVDTARVTLLGRPPTAQDTAAGIAIANWVKEGRTAAFSEDAGFNFYAGRDVVTNPTQLLNLYQNGQVDLTEMMAMLDEQRFDTVILRAQFYPPPVLGVIGQRYRTTELIEMNGFVYCIMAPK